MPATLRYSCPSAFYETFERKGGESWTTHYCPGCGHGLVHKYIAEAIDDAGLQDRTIFVSPVGCAVFAYYYFDVGHVQAAHGRCPAVATALKRAHPDSLVIGYQGDGDLAAIGGNEILHAANRGENLTVIFINNGIYGMTGGQMAPTTPLGMPTTTSPGGRRADHEGYPLKVCELLNALDAPYYLERVAVGDAKHNHKARLAVHKAIRYQVENKGFSLVEVLSPCPTGWKVPPVEAAARTVGEMARLFPLGVVRDGHTLDLGHPRRRAAVTREEIPALVEAGGQAVDGSLADQGRIDESRVILAGFGGQGVLLMGEVLATAGMAAGRHVAWMPSYGPEMRGGTANCAVTIADREIGSPLVERPTALVAMNGPSLERFAAAVVPDGLILYNSSIVNTGPSRTDVRVVPVPATETAARLGNLKVANMVALGALLAAGCGVSKDAVLAVLPSMLKSQPGLLDLDRKAIDAGMRVGVAVG